MDDDGALSGDLHRSTTLRARALDAAMALVVARGPDGINLRDIAAELNTGAASLYYHFKNKDALLAEVAAQGFRRLEAEVIQAYDDEQRRAAIRACGYAYLQFIRHNPMLYKLMYSERILTGHEGVRAAERQAFATFAQLIGTQEGDEDDLRNSALTLWALGRGIAALSIAADEAEPGAGRTLATNAVSGLEVLMGRPVRGTIR
ncbi:TetR/AcrR family transcriptional regulator [Phenylobacterium sp.]|uniref:TetR/AcrR family transcriptional regulator n=1 Tax=Phenylobacterium sp. TaxID=1871053 RepID=UPI00374D00F9